MVHAPQQVLQRSVPLLERQIDDAIAARPGTLDLVMSAVQIIDSAGLNWLLSQQARLETLGIRLRVVNPSAIAMDAFLATRLDSRLMVESTHAAETQGGTHGRG